MKLDLNNLKIRKTTEFFNNDYVNFASYDNIRKIPSLIDGQKNASRKILWFALQKPLKTEIKVSQLDSKVAEETEYLHGSMANVIVNLGQNHIGTNNINLMMPEGNFGTRLIPEASAPRYIYSYGSPEFFSNFSKTDNEILEHQTFEDHDIEPKFMLPKLPMLLINGADGITPGYASKILPRNPKEIEKYLRYYLTHPDAPKKPFKNKPFYRGFKGLIKQGDELSKWVIEGTFKKISSTKIQITELPIGYNLKSYLKVLQLLKEQKKITDYTDNSSDYFEFVISFNRNVLQALSDNQITDILKLRKKVKEHYTVMNERNIVQVYDNPGEIFTQFMDVKFRYLQKRKDHQIKQISQDIRVMISKYVFIKSIVDDTLQITKRPIEDIISDLEKIDKIISVDGYDYLLNMNIRSLTEERMKKLMTDIKTRKQELDFVKTATVQEMWLKDLD